MDTARGDETSGLRWSVGNSHRHLGGPSGRPGDSRAAVQFDQDGCRRLGYELHALAGAEDFIARSRPVIFGEFSTERLRSRSFAEDAPLQWAATHGYSAIHVHLRRAGSGYFTDRRHVVLKNADQPDREAEGLLLMPADERVVSSAGHTIEGR